MRLDGFSAVQRARVLRTTSGYNAFVPPPLPPAGILTELAGHARPRLFIAAGILDVLD